MLLILHFLLLLLVNQLFFMPTKLILPYILVVFIVISDFFNFLLMFILTIQLNFRIIPKLSQLLMRNSQLIISLYIIIYILHWFYKSLFIILKIIFLHLLLHQQHMQQLLYKLLHWLLFQLMLILIYHFNFFNPPISKEYHYEFIINFLINLMPIIYLSTPFHFIILFFKFLFIRF